MTVLIVRRIMGIVMDDGIMEKGIRMAVNSAEIKQMEACNHDRFYSFGNNSILFERGGMIDEYSQKITR